MAFAGTRPLTVDASPKVKFCIHGVFPSPFANEIPPPKESKRVPRQIPKYRQNIKNKYYLEGILLFLYFL